MPTVGWIQETAIDLFYERGGSVNSAMPKQHSHSCRHCGKTFTSKDARDLHEVEHPIANPILLIDGREVQRSTFKLSYHLRPESIDIAFVEQIVVNDKTCEIEELKQTLCRAKQQFFNIELHGKETKKSVRIDVQIADSSQLLQVDHKFRTYFSDDDFDGDVVMRFIKETEQFTGCIWYREGLVKYIQGVMAKDRRAEYLPFEEFSNRLNQSFTLLSAYETPLAVSLCQLIKFVMNDFHISPESGYIPVLDSALLFFNCGETSTRNWKREDGQLGLPTDYATEVILNRFFGFYSQMTINEMVNEVSRLNRKNLSLQDKRKLDFICLRKSIDENDIDRATYYRRRVRNIEEFKCVLGTELEG